jgi:hypothetical protein
MCIYSLSINYRERVNIMEEIAKRKRKRRREKGRVLL